MGSGGPTPAARAHKFFALANFFGTFACGRLSTLRIFQMKSVFCQMKSTGTAYAIAG